MSERDESSGSVKEIARREFCRRWGKRLTVALLAGGAGFCALRGYAGWREQHLASQVQEFVARGEYQSAVLVARRLLELDANNLAACTAMAEMAEKAGRAEAVLWRQRITHLQPADMPSRIALARSALRFGQHEVAERILETIPETSRGNVEFHEVAGACAMAAKRLDDAEPHFAAAAQLDPRNPRLAMNLAFVRLGSPDKQLTNRARRDIAQLVAEPAVRLECLRALTSDAVARNDRALAMQWAAQLRTEKESTFSDSMLCFQAYESTDKAAAVLEELKTKAATSPGSAAELITWLNRNGMAVVAASWSASLPPQLRATQPVPLAIAEAYSFSQDWKAMRAFVEGKDWGEFEAFRLAVESHALIRLGPADHPSMESQTTWQAALESAKRKPQQLVAIAQLAEGWGYQEKLEEAWWAVASGNENASAGLSALHRFYKAKHDTRGLLRVAKRALELNPGDLIAANNCASFGLLLNADRTACRLAARLHTEHPENHAFAATYAYALQTEGKLPEALQLMETLNEDELRHPAIAAYYFVMLVESGKLDRARSFLPAAKRASLLPEEEQLLTAATRKLLASETADGAKSVADAKTR